MTASSAGAVPTSSVGWLALTTSPVEEAPMRSAVETTQTRYSDAAEATICSAARATTGLAAQILASSAVVAPTASTAAAATTLSMPLATALQTPSPVEPPPGRVGI